MASNLLSLNSCITEFLLIELKRQLTKIHNSSISIDTTHYSVCSQLMPGEWTSFLLRISKFCYLTYVLFAVSVATLKAFLALSRSVDLSAVLYWCKSYLSSRTFCVKCNDCFFSLHTSLYGVPRGSVLGPLLFIMYTTPLSTLISSLSLYPHLYADDTQLFLSFHPSDFQANISHLQNALT